MDRIYTKFLGYLLVAVIGLGATPLAVHAVKLYKWVDEEGNVTYQETPPPAGFGQVEVKDIDPDRDVTNFVTPESSTTAPANKAEGAASNEKGATNPPEEQTAPGQSERWPEGVPPADLPHYRRPL